MDEKYKGLKKCLSELSGVETTQILLVEILGALIKVRRATKVYLPFRFVLFVHTEDVDYNSDCFLQSFPQDLQKVKTLLGGNLYAYEMPPMAPIPPMTAMEERGLSPSHIHCGLSEIQRMQNSGCGTSSIGLFFSAIVGIVQITWIMQ